MKIDSFLILLLILPLALISIPASAQGQHNIYPLSAKLQAKLHGHYDDVRPYVLHLKNGPNLVCPSMNIAQVDDKFDDIDTLISGLSLSPECIWKTISNNAKRLAKNLAAIHGFAFGAVLEASMAVGAQFGPELVIMPFDDTHLLVGMVRFQGGDLSIGLSGAGFTQAVIHGECAHSIWSYLGWFKSFSSLAITRSIGVNFPLIDENRSYCDALASTRGMNSSVIGISYTHYEQLGKFLLVSGPRTRSMIDFIKKLNTSDNTSLKQ